MTNLRVGFGLTGSFCTLRAALVHMQTMADIGWQVQPVVSHAVFENDTRFYTRQDLFAQIGQITDKPIWHTIPQAEVVGPQKCLDLMVIAPCTGNTLAKMVNGITDTPVLMAAKAQLRNGRPVVLAICTNDGLGINGANIGRAAALRGIYITPMIQDDPVAKSTSLVADLAKLIPTCQAALRGEQIQPIFGGSSGE